jgi:hypothetical protein
LDPRQLDLTVGPVLQHLRLLQRLERHRPLAQNLWGRRLHNNHHYKETKMKLFNFVTWTGIAIAVALAVPTAQAAAEVKKVCRVDAKTKKEVCKNIKVHKKVAGTPVPEKQKNK